MLFITNAECQISQCVVFSSLPYFKSLENSHETNYLNATRIDFLTSYVMPPYFLCWSLSSISFTLPSPPHVRKPCETTCISVTAACEDEYDIALAYASQPKLV